VGNLARYLAIDWDQGQLHIVEANVKGSTVRVQRAVVFQEERAPNPADTETLGGLLRDRLREAKIAPAPVLLCVGRDRLILKEVRYPEVPLEEEPAVVRFQAIKELSDNPEDVVIDYLRLRTREGEERRAACLVLRREMVQAYQQICKAAGLSLVGLVPRPVGIAASLGRVMGTTVVTPAPEPPDAFVAVVVLGERWAEMQIVRSGQLVMTRVLTPGPGMAGEIRRNLAIHNGHHPDNPVYALYLAGRGSGELRERLGDLLEDTPVYSFDPFLGTEVADLPAAGRGSFAGAMGLLHAQAHADLVINFLKPRQPQPKRTRPSRRLVMAGAMAVLLLAGFGVYASGEMIRLSAQVEEDKARLEGVKGRLTKTEENLKTLTALDDWENVVWLDELYDLAVRIPDVNALRVISFHAEPLGGSGKARTAAAVVTIKGKLLDPVNPRKALDSLVDRIKQEVYYSAEPPRVEKDQFTLKVRVKRRAPEDYVAALPHEGKADEGDSSKKKKDKGKGKGKGRKGRDDNSSEE
jgi:hypothetical protein